MELVIKIPEDWESRIETMSDSEIAEWLYNIIRNGSTSLPEGHGRLIDVKDLRIEIIAHKYTNDFCKEHNIDQSINLGMLNILIADAPTIIEADKEE